MIFSFDKNDKGFDSIFNDNLDFDDWVSKIPDSTLTDGILNDPALINDLYSNKDGISYIGSLYLRNNITSVRQTIGQVATTVGYLTTEFPNITNIFAQKDINKISLAVDTISKAGLDYKQGLNAIGAIPVVGWIIGIIIKVAQLVANIIKTVQQNNISDAHQKLISQYSIPVAKFNKYTDEALTKICMEHVGKYDMNWLFSPRYVFDDFDDFIAVPEKNESPDDVLVRAFNISSNKVGGMGFIPGTTDIFAAMRLITSVPKTGGSSTSNMGDFYPTVRNLCISLYEMIQKPSPALFSITPSKLATEWEDNIYNMLVYSEKSLIKGWSGFQTGNINMDTFLCAGEVFGQLDCKKSKANDNIKIPKTTDPFGHFNSFRDDIFTKFFNGKYKEKKLINDLKQLTWTSKNINVKESIPSLALKNIKDTQYAVINSLNCCYVDDERFAAIKEDTTLGKKWSTNINAVLNSNEWKKLRFLDIPDGEFKSAVYNKAIKAKFKNFDTRVGPIDNQFNIKTGPSILGDPKPPSPFKIESVSEIGVPVKKTVPKSENNLVGAMAIAALGVGFLVLKK